MLLFAIFVEVLLLIVVITACVRERQALRRFVRAAGDPERLKDLAMQLPPAYRAPATQFAGELIRKGSIDELIVQAVTQAANTMFGFPLWLRLIVFVGLSCFALLPLGSALFEAATQIGESVLAVQGQGLSGSRAFLGSKPLLEESFGKLYIAAQGTAWISAGLVIVGAVHWLLNRSEVREARFVEALLEAAISARPGASAPVASRLSELVAPERSLGMPIFAFIFFFVAAGAGWLLLHLTADVKEANVDDVYSVWPDDARLDLKPHPTMQIPVSRRGGGSPIPKEKVATLSIESEKLTLTGGNPIEREGTKFKSADAQNALAAFKGWDLAVLADRRTKIDLLVEVLNLLRELGIKQVFLVFERTILIKGVSGGDRVFAGIPFQLNRSNLPPVFTLAYAGSSVAIDAGDLRGEQIDMRKRTWAKDLSDAARARIGKGPATIGEPQVAVEINAKDLIYDKLIELLSLVDTTCERDADCGVPGVGLTFYFSKPPPVDD